MDDDDLFESRSIGEYVATFRRRRLFVLLTGSTIFTLALLAALFWPALFVSSATILIEEPEVPDTLVRSTILSDQDERLKSIQERVMTTQNLMGIIDKFNLFRSDRNSVPATDLAHRIRKRTKLSLVGANANGSRNDRTRSDTIAFTLSFGARDPASAQQVTNEIVTLYLSENARARQAQAGGTVGFLSAEAQRLADQIRTLESRLADFKTKYSGGLPEQFQLNMQLLDRAEQRLSELMRQQESSRERQAFLQTQLAQLDPNLPIAMPNGEPILSGETLRLQYISLSAKLGENNPAVIKVRRQMEAMGVNPDATATRAALSIQHAEFEKQLAYARQKYGVSHPEVQRLERQVAAIKTEIAALAPATSAFELQGATSPTYIQIRSQLAAETIDLQGLAKQEADLRVRLDSLSTRLLNSPQIERDYMELKRNYDSTVAQYRELTSKQSDAELANSLETERKGERFSVIEPPDFPITPVAPNRTVILVFGTLLALMMSLGGAIGLDTLSGRIYGRRQLANLVGANPVAIVPYFAALPRDRHKPWWKQRYLAFLKPDVYRMGGNPR
jgi:uncharacterized protein involved in exopolysaccharide biosynthesis